MKHYADGCVSSGNMGTLELMVDLVYPLETRGPDSRSSRGSEPGGIRLSLGVRAIIAVVAVLVGCSSGERVVAGPEASANSIDVQARILEIDAASPLIQLLATIAEFDATSAFEADRVQQEEFIAACMRRNGFEYLPSPPAPDGPEPYYRGLEPGTRDWADQYGLGVTTLWFEQEVLSDLIGSEYLPDVDLVTAAVDANGSYLSSLSTIEYDAYQAAMSDAGGCLSQSIDQMANLPQNRFATDFQDQLADLSKRIDADRRMIDANAEAARCLAEAGVQFTSHDDATTYFAQQLARPEFNGQSGSLDAAATHILRSLQAEEVAFAIAQFDCDASPFDLYVLRAKIRDEYEQEFIQEHKAEIAQYGLS